MTSAFLRIATVNYTVQHNRFWTREDAMKDTQSILERPVDRRSFIKKGAIAAGAATVGAGLLSHGLAAFGESKSNSSLNQGDIAILQFLAAAELIESDLWQQYAELGGIGSNPPIEVDPNQQLNNYQIALSNLDGDGPQYISSNTLDEISHATFLNAYLESQGADPVNLDKYRTLQGSKASPAANLGRLTNLMQLNVDTSWYVRYRSTTNPEFGATFPQAITLNNVYAIPRNNSDFNGPPFSTSTSIPGNVHIQAIANIAAFHFGYIEQGGSSLYATLSQKVTSLEVLKITLGIGGDEVAHFLEWVDFAGNGVQAPVAPFTDPGLKLTFPNFFSPLNPLIQPSLIFPVPCQFINQSLPLCAAIRPSSDQFSGAMAAVNSFIADGLFIGQSSEFITYITQLATAADAASRQG
jgi:hypothetical protein